MRERVQGFIAGLIEEFGIQHDYNKRLRQLQESTNNLLVTTFHAAALGMTKESTHGTPHFSLLGYKQTPQVMADTERHPMLKKILLALPRQEKLFTVDEMSQKMERAISGQSNLPYFPIIKKVCAQFQALKLKESLIDFSDMLTLAVQLLEKHEQVLTHYQQRYTHFLVDEYQDSNDLQYKFIRLLLGNRHALTVVGDDAQSIYRFRGANVKNILHFQKDFPLAKTVKLEINYRSTPKIIHAANKIFPRNANVIKKHLRPFMGNKNPHFLANNRIRLLKFSNEKLEVNFMAKEIHGLLKTQQVTYKDVGILYRNNYQGERMINFLQDKGLPYSTRHDPEDTPANDDAIQLSTVHAAKGLEYPVVFFVGLEESLCPSLPKEEVSSEEFNAHLEEERRLFYVGVTRAQFRLYLTYLGQRQWYNRKVKFKKSRFLKRIPLRVK